MIVLLNYMTTLTHLRNGRFWWDNIEISQNAMALIANMSNRKRNSRNFPFGNTLNVTYCTKQGKRQNFTNSQHNLCY